MTRDKIIGGSFSRMESVLKVTGQALYTDDITLPNMIYGMVLHSPHPHARVVDIDTIEALKVSGVLRIISPKDVPQLRFNCSGNPPSPLLFEDELILTREPLYVGDRIAAVAAETREACIEAIRKIRVRYEILTPLLDLNSALMEKAKPIHPEISSTNIIKKIEASQGSIERGFKESFLVMEDIFETPAIQNISMEPNGCICDYAVDGTLTIISTSQTPFQERRILARLMGMKESDVRIVKPTMGGGFGERQQLHYQPIGCLLSRELGRPVKMIHTREEQMYASSKRHSAKIHLKIGVSQEGNIQAFHAQAYYDTGAYTTHGPTVVAAASRKTNYCIPHFLFEGYCVYTNNTPSGAVRGYGNPQMTYARELLLDRIARELKVDPIEFKRRNHVKIGDCLPGSTEPLLSCAMEECLREGEAIRKSIDAQDQKEVSQPWERSAWGVAFCCHTSGPSSKEGMSSGSVAINHDGTVILSTGSADIGQGSETILAQIVAETLGARLDDIRIVAGDTMTTPYDTGTFASSQTYVGGNAVLGAAKEAREKILYKLAKKYDIEAQWVTFTCGHYKVSCPEKPFKSLTLKEVMQQISFGEHGSVILGTASYKAHAAPPPFAICWAKTQFNERSRTVRVTHVIESVDVGNPINPGLVEGQVQGGIGMGVGYACMERMEFDRKERRPISSDLLHYNVPLPLDMPEIHVHIAKSYEPTGPYGAKSVGELATVPVGAAIGIAIENATGEKLSKIPFTHSYCPQGPFSSQNKSVIETSLERGVST